jgi:hypothetical protein
MTGEVEFPEPWFADDAPGFARELHRELAPGHILYGMPVSAVARRQDCDDVLFALDDGSGRVAVVHLTWSRETNPPFPVTDFFDSFSEWSESMRVDHDECDT